MIHRDIGAMTLWAFSCAVDGFAEMNGAKRRGGGEIADDRLSELEIEGF